MKQQEDKNDFMRSYSKYMGMTFQMILVIVMGGFGGKALDGYFRIENHLFTIVLIILAAVIALFLLFKTLFNK
jgi:uncharacterized membrane protein